MKNSGNLIGLLVVLAIPLVAVLWLYGGAEEVPPPKKDEPIVPFTPAPLYTGEPQQGLTFRSLDKLHDVRGFAQIALYVPEGAAPSRFSPKGRFRATWKGKLRIPTRERYTFGFAGTGAFELVLKKASRDGQDVVAVQSEDGSASGKRARLSKGELEFEASYTSPAKGPAIVRVYWECDEFSREPIPVEFVTHGTSASLEQFARLRRGGDLVQELRCGRCHVDEATGLPPPPLADAGARLNEAYMAWWIENPDPRRMPRMLHGATKAKDAADLAAYLASLGAPGRAGGGAPVDLSTADAEAGKVLYADYGCVACHTLPDQKPAAERHSLAHVAHRFHTAAFVDYLKQPEAHHPGGKMPNFGLSDEQARNLAAFLLSREGAPAPPHTQGDSVRGKQLAGAKGCGTCHGLPVPGPDARQRAIRGADVDCSFAQFDLTDAEQGDLREYLARRLPESDDPVERVEHAIHTYRCTSCHAWRGTTAPLDSLQDEVLKLVPPDPEGHPHRPAPDLTQTGSKLRSEWLTKWLRGEIAERPRPWMHTRMPTFSRTMHPDAWVRGFAWGEGFALSDAKPSWQAGTELVEATAGAAYDPAPADAAAMLAAGDKLLPRNGGLGCVQCHAVGDKAAEEVFEAPGVALDQTPVRLRKEFFLRWCLDPLRIDPTTKMTKFADEEGVTGLTDVLEGDARAQFEAIWRALSQDK